MKRFDYVSGDTKVVVFSVKRKTKKLPKFYVLRLYHPKIARIVATLLEKVFRWRRIR